MNLTCQLAHERLLEGVVDAALSEHIRTCEACRSFAFELESIDSDLAALPRIDAPEFLVERTLARVSSDAGLHLVQASAASFASPPEAAPQARETSPTAPVDSAPLGLGALLLAALSMLIAAVGALVFLPLTVLHWVRDVVLGIRAQAPALPQTTATKTATAPAATEDAALSADIATLQKNKHGWTLPIVLASGVCAAGGLVLYGTQSQVYSRMSEANATMGSMGGFEEAEYEPAPQYASPAASAPTTPSAPVATSSVASGGENANGTDPMAALAALMGDQAGGGFGGLGLRGTGRGGGGTGEGTIGLGNRGTIGHGAESTDAPADEPVAHRRARRATTTEASSTRRIPARISSRSSGLDDGLVDEAPAENFRSGREDEGRFAARVDRAESANRWGDLAQGEVPEAAQQDQTGETTETVIDERFRQQLMALGYSGQGGYVDETNADVDRSRVSSMWADAQRTTGLTFAAHDGWWENTYVPGDSAIRMLQARVASSGHQYLSNAELASPTVPTVAAPTERAMAVGVHADRAAIEGPTRVRVEVGLRGIAQAAGRRGALRIALVIDAEDALDANAQARIRSLVNSLARSAGSRDRVMLVAAGAHGGTLVPLGAMRAGAVEVALRHLFGSGDRSATRTSLTEAVSAAVQGVTSDDGAGLVLLATPDGVHDAALEEVIRQGALGGVVTSAIGIATSATSNLDAIALAGQGRRGLVLNDADANRVVRSELTATARLIARALRLRVRLAPGVELIEVLGSHPLNQEESRRTRATETAIDQQLSRRLGIASDRDDDQDGIRILLPSFYAGDSHTVVLDLLVSRPGPVVDVDVQFKDLVRLGNGNVSAALALPSGTAARGVREQRVLASYIAHRVSMGLAAAGDLASHGDWSGARTRIEETRALIADARREVPALAALPSVQADEALLAQYLTSVGGGLQPQHVADSLHYASHRRLLLPQLATIE